MSEESVYSPMSSSFPGEMDALVRSHDWSKTPLGPAEGWPSSLRLMVEIMLVSGFPMAVRWGPEFVLIYNDGYKPILGDKHPGALGLAFRDAWPEVQTRLAPLHEAILAGTNPGLFSEDLPLTIRRRGDQWEEARFTISYSPIPDPTSHTGVGGILVTAVETTERVHTEKALRDAETALRQSNAALQQLNTTLEHQVLERTARLRAQEEELRQAQKMEAMGQLTGGVAHDFNNLLQVIVGNLETLQRNLPAESGRLRRATDNAMNGARRAATLTQRLLAFSRRQPLEPKPINVNELVTGMSELLHRSIGETISVETVLSAGVWRTEADPNQLESALLNLAVNARDAMPAGGKLTIETANTHIDEGYAANQAEVSPGQYVVVCVSDTGLGMDKATIARVFEPFFTTKEPGKGTGLGLSQVYGFVKQSGGHVQVYSEQGQGTTVKIYLRRLLGEASQEDIIPAAIVPEGTKGETILVVEDDDDVRAYSVDILRELGYRVVEAHDGPSAVRLLERQAKVDLLFSDVVLPGGWTGAQTASQARALRPGLKVLFTTGYARNAIVHHGRLDAGVHLITKPFTFAELAAKVRDVLDISG
jgi:signal transduction histidine kinase/CheY-like chemotaxis protein